MRDPADLRVGVCSRDSLWKSSGLLEGCLNLCQEAVWGRKQVEMVFIY